MKIYTTNLKLFYDIAEESLLDEIITTFASLNLSVKHQNLRYIDTIKKSVEVPIK